MIRTGIGSPNFLMRMTKTIRSGVCSRSQNGIPSSAAKRYVVRDDAEKMLEKITSQK